MHILTLILQAREPEAQRSHSKPHQEVSMQPCVLFALDVLIESWCWAHMTLIIL